ncbi:DNA excision repair protein ERCC-5-like isoform X2 [Clavelina lepadiformis]
MAVKGMRDLHGYSANNAHLITLFNRICKLLYFGVKPVFVFDGQAPLLKQQTLNDRRQKKYSQIKEKKSATEKLLQNYLKRRVLELTKPKGPGKDTGDEDTKEKALNIDAATKAVQEARKVNQEDDIFKLPDAKNPLENSLDSSDEEREEQWRKRASTREAVYGAAMSGDFQQMMAIDFTSDDFKALPQDIQHELLHDIKEIRKRRRTQIETMPDNSESFSSYQLKGLLAKRNISERIEKIEHKMEMDNAMSMEELGFNARYEMQSIEAKKISSDDTTHYILIKGLKKKLNDNDKDADLPTPSSSKEVHLTVGSPEPNNSAQLLKDDMSSESSNEDITEIRPSLSDRSAFEEKEDSNGENGNVIELTDQTLPCSDKVNPIVSISSPDHTAGLGTINTSISKEQVIVNKHDWKYVQDVAVAAIKVDQVFSDRLQAKGNIFEVEGSLLKDSDLTAFKKIHKNDVTIPKHVSITDNPINGNDKQRRNDEEVKQLLSSDEDFVPVDEEGSLTLSETSSQEEKGVKEISQSKSEINPWQGLDEEDLAFIGEKLDLEDAALLERIKTSARAARDVSNTATVECQNLLQLFGVPYIISPQEAESQCAFLENAGLTMGTITEDSDIWLFGGKFVLKDVFDKKRNPSSYSFVDIKAELGLEQSHFINIALCSGCDYTSGIDGVGPVKALEIMKEFPGQGIESLLQFKQWWQLAHKQVNLIVKETKIKGQLRKVNLPSSFPSQMVVDAYIKPVVNESKETFSWGLPDLDGIRDFASERLKWARGRVDEALLPILKRASERNAKQQQILTTYFPRVTVLPRTLKTKSKRVMRAVAPLLGTGSDKGEKQTTNKESNKHLIKTKPTKRRNNQRKVVIPNKTMKNNVLALSESSSSEND